MALVTFSMIYYYPDRTNPELIIESKSGGYLFEFPEQPSQNFMLSHHLVHDLSSNQLGINIYQDAAVAKFREFGKEQWPQTFK